MFTFEQVKELVELVARLRISNLEIDRAGFRLRISGEAPFAVRESSGEPRVTTAGQAPAAEAASAHGPTAGSSPATAGGPHAESLHVVASPIVGTFYSAPSPDSPSYVRVGDRISKGQVLCIVEAMKLLNEIESDVDGVVAEIYPKNAQPVEYGESLFGVRAD